MQWTTTDTRYAAATAAAVALVAYLMAGNFGLVPSPLTGLRREPLTVSAPAVNVGPPLAALSPAAAAAEIASLILPPTPPPPVVPPPPPPPPDLTAPATTFTTPDGAVLTMLDDGGPLVTGTVADNGGGVAAVEIRFSPSVGEVVMRSADLECAGPDRRNCTWSARAPEVAGTYQVTARASDRSGNVEDPGPEPIEVTVVSAPGADGGSQGLLGSLIDRVGGLLGL